MQNIFSESYSVNNRNGSGIKGALAFLLITALVITSVFAVAPFVPFASDGEVHAAGGNIPAPYPWSKTETATTGDYIADVYDGIDEGKHVFEDLTVDRLADVLSAAGDYYIVFASPTKDTAQKILSVIGEQAKAAGITKIYHFNPVLDNKYLDITSADPVIQNLGVSTLANFAAQADAPTGAENLQHRIGNIQKYINYFLPNDARGDAIRAYKSSGTLLFRFHKDAHTDLASEAAIDAAYQLNPADLSYGYSKSVQAAKIAKVFRDDANTIVPASVRTDYQFFERVFRGTLPDEDVISDEKYPNGQGFNLKALTFPAAFNLLNSPGEHAIYFGASGCPNTKATLGYTAKQAKAHGRTVYYLDGSLDGSIRFGFGEDIDRSFTSTNNAWINIRLGQRSNGTVPSGYAGVGHLYGALFSYFGSGINTENWSRSGQTVFYYENGYDAVTGVPTNRPYGAGASEEGPFDAPRLQYPYLISYNKDYEQPVTISTTAIQYGERDGAPYLTEYMLSVGTVNSAWLGVNAAGWQPGDPIPTTVGALSASNTRLYLNAFTDYNNVLDTDYLKSVRRAQLIEAGGGDDDPDTDDPDRNGDGGNQNGDQNDDQGDNNQNRNQPDDDRQQAAAPTKVFATASSPWITGTARLGSVLKAVAGAWSDKPSFLYQWYRDGDAISGATAATYKATAADVGKRLQVEVTAGKDGYTSVSKISSATKSVEGVFSGVTAPKITGTAKVGKTLKTKVSGVSPAPNVKYQWYANGKAIKGATKASLKLKKAQKGKTITVKATLTRADYAKKTVTSKATKKVK
jgi:hypothetical protein